MAVAAKVRPARSLALAPEVVHAAVHAAVRRFGPTPWQVTLDVRGRTVVVAGDVASWAEHQAIIRAVMAVPGVVAVDDRLVRWEL